MSWLNKINSNGIEITTGDKNIYRPSFIASSSSRKINFNTQQFDFIDINGSFISRETHQAAQYNLEVYFTGDDNIDAANNFIISAKDKRAWTISHPIYDNITVQPIEMEEITSYGLTKLNILVSETILNQYPLEEVNIINEIAILNEQLLTSTIDVLNLKLTSPAAQTAISAKNSTTELSNALQKILTVQSDINNFKNSVNKTTAAAVNLLVDVNTYAVSIKETIETPFEVVSSVSGAINQSRSLLSNLTTLLITNSRSKENDLLWEMQTYMIISNLAKFLSINNYVLRTDVDNAIFDLTSIYKTVNDTIDNNQISIDVNNALLIDNVINKTLSNLYLIAYNSKQIRRFTLINDTPVILLAHKYFGINDESLENFININNVQLFELLELRAGREVIYYV